MLKPVQHDVIPAQLNSLDNPANDGVKVSAVGLDLPDVNDIVTATGICTMEKVSGDRFAVILARDQDDIVVL